MISADTEIVVGEAIANRRAARERLVPFCEYTFVNYERSPHTDLLSEYLEAVERRDILRLIVNMPPRHSKSEHVSRRLPAWYLGRNPEHGIIAASYADSLALSMSWAVREIIREPRYQSLWPRSLATSALRSWGFVGKQNKVASYIAAGVGGGITGQGAHLFIIDDPIKNRAIADSEVYREHHWKWYVNVVRTRLAPGGAIIICMTRYHENDLVGRLTTQANEDNRVEDWTVLNLSALCEDVDDVLGRELGEALWPSWYGAEELAKIQALDPYEFSSLYQGRPTQREGSIFKHEWWRYYDEHAIYSMIVLSWDTAFKKEATAHYSAFECWGVHAGGIDLLDAWRGRPEFPELLKLTKDFYEQWKMPKGGPTVVLIEDKASGQSLLQSLRLETRLPVVAVKVDKDKVARAAACTPQVQANVRLPRSAPWLQDWIQEHEAFPNGKFDDWVDATAHALNWIMRWFDTASQTESQLTGVPKESLWRREL